TCTFTNEKDANIVVVKETVGGDGDFTFDPSWDDDFVLSNGESDDSGDLDPGNYDVAETEQDGWDLTNTECVSSNGDDETAGAIDLQAGETVTCTFTNTKRGSIVVAKETDPDGDPAVFQFERSWVDNEPDTDHDLELSDDQSDTSIDLLPGPDYSVAELALAGWDLETLECVNGDGIDQGDGTNMTLDPGETITCTFTNEKDANITVTKVTAGGDGEFTFNPSWGADFVLSDGQTNDSGDLDPSTYSVSEDVPGGWQLTNTDCVSSNGDVETIGNIDLQAGETVDCTFTNTKSGSIAVRKVTVPAESPQLFDFTGDVTAELSDGQTSPPVPVEPGQYNVVETALAGWDLTDIDCEDGNSFGSLVSGTAMINVSPGEDVVCTFTNTQRSRIDVLKVDDAGNTLGGVTFSLYSDGDPLDGAFDPGGADTDTGTNCTTDAAGECSFDDLVPGGYWVVEDEAPDGHIGAEPQFINLLAGDLDSEIELEFENERLHKAIVLTCHMGTNDLVASDVTIDGVDITTIEADALVGTDLEELEAALCALAGVEDLEHEMVDATIDVGSVGGGLHP
ncbi:MAG TPA: prealbumin-like fold domain-containing protein, partial [Nitriliruptoraceae bacterium]|nr:prealbumin-like fold domain-containing protein [Nitriliruptoraceae bacterium]